MINLKRATDVREVHCTVVKTLQALGLLPLPNYVTKLYKLRKTK